MKNRHAGLSQTASAAKVGISERSGRRIEKGELQPQRHQARHWRTRKDSFFEVWESELEPLLQREPSLTGTTLWEVLDERYPGVYPESKLRSLQRRVKHWKGCKGPDKEVMFRQSMPAGQQGLSDFTHPNTPITIAGEAFDHMLYQYRLAYSGWRSVTVIQGGESYSALADGLQNALHQAGGSPLEHRTDSLSAAYVNQAQEQTLTRQYQALCQHYRMTASRNNRGVSHENGAIETAHGSFKHRLSQALKVRGSTDFESVQAYQQLVNKIAKQLNRRCQGRFRDEQKHLQPLPKRRFMDFSELSAKVTSSSTINVRHCLYSVPSRLIGEHLRIHLYHDRLLGFLGSNLVFELARIYPKPGYKRARQIDFRHVIHVLSAKPQAFRYSQIRDDLFPTPAYQTLWTLIDQQLEPRAACKWMVGVLRLVAEDERRLGLADELLAQAGEQGDETALPDLKTLQNRFMAAPPQAAAAIPLAQHSLQSYDSLLSSRWTQEVAHV